MKTFELLQGSYQQYVSLALFLSVAVVLVGLEHRTAGFTLLLIGLAQLSLTARNFAKNMGLVYACMAVLGVIPIVTSTSLPAAAYMGAGLLAVVVGPYVVSRYLYKENLIRFPDLREKRWRRRWTAYLLFIAVAAYLVLPFMLRDTGAYLNWQLQPGFGSLVEAYLGLNFVGVWDELFFVCTILAILQRYFPFYLANLAQAVLFTSFLYTLAFTGWSFVVVYLFALLQGYVFRQTKSLLFILAVHLTVDLVLHLTLVYLHFPQLYPWMIG